MEARSAGRHNITGPSPSRASAGARAAVRRTGSPAVTRTARAPIASANPAVFMSKGRGPPVGASPQMTITELRCFTASLNAVAVLERPAPCVVAQTAVSPVAR